MNIANKIDHTLLKADATTQQIITYCNEAKQYGFASVCVNSYHVPQVSKQLAGSNVKVCSVIGFPLGAMATAAKVFETKQAVADGANEIDMVINIGAVKEKAWPTVLSDIAAVVEAAKPAIVKVIIETCLLTNEEKVQACKTAEQAGAAFVKTSTGFSTGGATVEDVRLMRQAVSPAVQVKASGGIRTHEFAMQLIAAGADRIGAGNGIVLL